MPAVHGADAVAAGPVVSTVLHGIVPSDPPSIFSDIFDFVERAHYFPDHYPILKAACSSSAFTCAEIIRLVNSAVERCNDEFDESQTWTHLAMIFAEGRSNDGCISDPAKSSVIPASFTSKFHDAQLPPAYTDLLLNRLEQAFIGNRFLKPARDVVGQPVLPTGIRTDKDMKQLLTDMDELQLLKLARSHPGRLRQPKPWRHEFNGWLKHIRANGQQFSGTQIRALVHAIPSNLVSSIDTADAIRYLLHHLEQYVTGVTCKEVNQILEQVRGLVYGDDDYLKALDALMANIIDGQNKVSIVASAPYPLRAEELLRYVGAGPHQ